MSNDELLKLTSEIIASGLSMPKNPEDVGNLIQAVYDKLSELNKIQNPQ